MAFVNHGLGKSLSEVFAKTPRRDGGRGFLEVDIGLLVPPSHNPRQVFDETALEELATSIRQHGILQPIVVMKQEAGYEIVSGERRFRAAKLAGLSKVPVVVREGGDDAQEVAELRLIENIQRENLNPIELARAYQALVTDHGLTQEQVAEQVGKERSSVANSLRLLGLPSQIQDEVGNGALSQGHAKALLACADDAWRLQLARQVIEEGLSVRETERLAKRGPGEAPPSGPGKPAHIKELEANLLRLFGTKVKIKEKGGKGSLSIQFVGKEQFQRVVTLLDRAFKQAGGL
jgi:ParB family transcriptional regulator, chromosome partitioning protein